MDWELNLPFDYPPPADAVERSNQNPLSTEQLNGMSGGISQSIQLPNFDIPPGTGQIVTFRGTIQTDKYIVINPDPSLDWSTFIPASTATSDQILGEVYVPEGWQLVCEGEANNYSNETATGVMEYGGGVSYQVFLRDPENNKVLVYPISYYRGLKRFGWIAKPSFWVGRGGVQIGLTFSTVNCGVTPRPIPRQITPPPPPPPQIPPPINQTPPCDIAISTDPSIGEGHFCMSFAEYDQYLERNRRANERLETITNFMNQLP